MALRSISLEALEDIETEKQKKAMDDLLAQKALVEEHFLLIVQANKGDVERATNFATLYHRSLSSWLDHEVTQLAADVRNLAWLGLCWDVPRGSDLMISLLKLDETVTNHRLTFPHHLTFAFPIFQDRISDQKKETITIRLFECPSESIFYQAAKFYSRCPIHKNPSRWPSRCLLVPETGAMS